jgi:hypothetical protein
MEMYGADSPPLLGISAASSLTKQWRRAKLGVWAALKAGRLDREPFIPTLAAAREPLAAVRFYGFSDSRKESACLPTRPMGKPHFPRRR